MFFVNIIFILNSTSTLCISPNCCVQLQACSDPQHYNNNFPKRVNSVKLMLCWGIKEVFVTI